MVLKKIQAKVNNSKPIRLLVLLIITSFIFSIIYHFIPNKEFATWVSTDLVQYNLGYQFLNYMFDMYSNSKNQITKERLLKMPIYKDINDGKIHILIEGNEVTKALRSIKIKEELFDIYKNKDNVITSTIFSKIPFSIENISSKKILSVVPHNYYEKYADKPVYDYKDKLYFSIVTQTLLGYGDIIPASDRVRMLVIVQILISLYFMV